MDHREIAGRFNARLGRRFRTLLVGGAEEPLYLPPAGRRPALIRYTRDYPRSALHEIAHWCLAGSHRRAQVDYGLWYLPPPRSERDQAQFYAAEVPVQGLEMVLAAVCGLTFHFSADNPGADGGPARRSFEQRVRHHCLELCGTLRAGLWEGRADLPVLAVVEALNAGWRHFLPDSGQPETVSAG